MVSRRVLYVVLLLAMFLISSEVAEARELMTETSNYKEGKGEKIGSDARFECPNGCCGVASPYCRCCAYPAAQDQHPHRPPHT